MMNKKYDRQASLRGAASDEAIQKSDQKWIASSTLWSPRNDVFMLL
jgi:hypothetical protein